MRIQYFVGIHPGFQTFALHRCCGDIVGKIAVSKISGTLRYRSKELQIRRSVNGNVGNARIALLDRHKTRPVLLQNVGGLCRIGQTEKVRSQIFIVSIGIGLLRDKTVV